MKKPFKALIGAAVALLICIIAAYITLAIFYQDVFQVNTWINGVYCAGRNVESVEDSLLAKLEHSGNLEVVGYANLGEGAEEKTYTISMEELQFEISYENALLQVEGVKEYVPEETEFDFSVIAPFIPSSGAYVTAAPEDKSKAEVLPDPPKKSLDELKAKIDEFTADEDVPFTMETPPDDDSIPPALRELMTTNNVTEEEIRRAVANEHYFTYDTPIKNYGDAFINGCLIAAWEQVYSKITQSRKNK